MRLSTLSALACSSSVPITMCAPSVTALALTALEGRLLELCAPVFAPRIQIPEPAAVAAMQRLSSLGHRIGLHFDAAAHAVGAIDRAVEGECAVLESLTGRPVTMVSFHRPAPELLGHAAPLGGRAHAYQPRFFSDMGYCSDSRGRWGHGHPLEHPAVAEGRALQLLTHPIWWTREVGEGVVPRLDRFVGERTEVLRTELAANCEPYRQARS